MSEPSIRAFMKCTPEEEAAMVAAIMMFERDRDSGRTGAARPVIPSGR
jgi:hypothetical protein